MSLSENNITLIEKYLAGDLNDSEMTAFKKMESGSEAFSKEVRLQRMMIASIRMKDDDLLRSELKEEAKMIDFSSQTKSFSKYWYYAAASISAVIIACYFLLPTGDSLFTAYYSPLPESPIPRGETFHDNLYEQAMQAYSKGSFKQALDLFLTLDDGSNRGIDLFIGNCLLSLEKTEEAITYFAKAAESGNEQIQSHANWYLALAYLKADTSGEATPILKSLSESDDNMYQQKASELLSKKKWVIF